MQVHLHTEFGLNLLRNGAVIGTYAHTRLPLSNHLS